jgi:hypothetical protein
MRRHQRHQAQVVDVLVGHDDQVDVLERVAERVDAALQHVERGGRVGTGVDERERVILDQVDVDPTDREGRGDGKAVDTRGGRRRIRVLCALGALLHGRKTLVHA